MTAPGATNAAAQPLIEMRQLHAGYGGGEVLRGIDLAVREGEVLAILGRNGAGKTTLLNTLFNLGPQARGEIRVRGGAVAGWPTHRIARLGLALVPQGRGVFPDLAVHENLRLATLAARAPVRWTLDEVYALFPRLRERRRAPSGTLSGGERQMLAIGRALLTQADAIALDEPSEGLAPLLVEEVLAPALRALTVRGTTLLLVEQNLGLALGVASRVLVLAQGRIAYEGGPAQLAAEPDTLHRLVGV